MMTPHSEAGRSTVTALMRTAPVCLSTRHRTKHLIQIFSCPPQEDRTSVLFPKEESEAPLDLAQVTQLVSVWLQVQNQYSVSAQGRTRRSSQRGGEAGVAGQSRQTEVLSWVGRRQREGKNLGYFKSSLAHIEYLIQCKGYANSCYRVLLFRE